MDEVVRHTTYGAGKVTERDRNHISVVFEGMPEKKTFQYPEAFEKFLEFEDEKLQQEARAQWEALKAERSVEAENHKAIYELHEEERRKNQKELLKKRRKAAQEKKDRDNHRRRSVEPESRQ